MFNPPTLTDPETCQVKGSLPVSIELIGVEVIKTAGAEEENVIITEDEPSSGFTTHTSFAVAMLATWIGGLVV